MITNQTPVVFKKDQLLANGMLAIDSVLVNNKSISFGQSKALNPCFVGGKIKNEAQLAAHVVLVAVFLLWCLFGAVPGTISMSTKGANATKPHHFLPFFLSCQQALDILALLRVFLSLTQLLTDPGVPEVKRGS